MAKIAIIGAGCLGSMVLDALYSNGHREIIATRTKKSAIELDGLRQKYPDIEVTSDNTYAANLSEIIILGVKPGLIDDVSREIAKYSQNKLVISLAAAKSLKEISQNIGHNRIARVMTGLFVDEEIAFFTMHPDGFDQDRESIKHIFGKNAIEVEEDLLANRTYIGCDTGLIPLEIESKVKKLSQLGMSEADARKCYGAMLIAVGKRLFNGENGNNIFNEVGGPKSFTKGLADYLLEAGYFKLIEDCIEKTVKACRK